MQATATFNAQEVAVISTALSTLVDINDNAITGEMPYIEVVRNLDKRFKDLMDMYEL